MVKINEMRDSLDMGAYVIGQEAFEQGFDIDDNPYSEDDVEYDSWIKGWKFAQTGYGENDTELEENSEVWEADAPIPVPAPATESTTPTIHDLYRIVNEHSGVTRLTPKDIEQIREIVRAYENDEDVDDLLANGDLYDKLYQYYMNNGEMPYGTAKARTGDPAEWILNKIVQDFGGEETNRNPRTNFGYRD